MFVLIQENFSFSQQREIHMIKRYQKTFIHGGKRGEEKG